MRTLTLTIFGIVAFTPNCWGASAGDVIFSEVMWMGDFASPENEWMELRNMTSEPIDLTGWTITVFNFRGQQEELMLAIPEGILPAAGFFLIANSSEADSNIDVTPDLVDERVALPDAELQLKLYEGRWNAGGKLIDIADDGRGTPIAGTRINARKSMVRNDPPRGGDQFGSWHTADTSIGWDEGTEECGTPSSASIFLPPGLTVSPVTLDFVLPQPGQSIAINNRTSGQLQWGIFEAPEWLSISPTTGVTSRSQPTQVDVAVLIENVPAQTHQGSFEIRNLADASQTKEVTVSVNRLPILRPLADRVSNVGEPINLTVSAVDPDGDGLTFTAQSLPEGARLDPETGEFTWTPASPQQTTVEFQVNDDYGGVVSQRISIEVISPPPYRIEVELRSEMTQITDNPSKGVQYDLRVRSLGTMPDEVDFSVVPDAENPSSSLIPDLRPPSVFLAPGSQAEAHLTIRGDVGVTPGEYGFSVIGTSRGDVEQRKTVAVTTIVQERPVLELKPIFDEARTHYRLNLRNPTGMPLNWESDSPNWIAISQSTGHLPPESTTQLEAKIQFDALLPGTHEGTVEFRFVASEAVSGAPVSDMKQTVPFYVNRRPTITLGGEPNPTATVSHTTDAPLEIPIRVSDPDGDAVALSAPTGLPEGAEVIEAEPGPEAGQLITALRWDAPIAGNYTLLLQATDSLGATAQQTIELEIILKTTWVVNLHPNRPNLLHIPVSDSRFPTVSRLFNHLRPTVEQILTYDTLNQTFRAYTDLSVPGRGDDLPLRPYTGIIVFLKADSPVHQIAFEGTPYTDTAVPLVGSQSNAVINLIGLPVNDPRLKTLGDVLELYPQITGIIGQNADGQLASTETADLPITGGQAFIVFSEGNIELRTDGIPWTQDE